MLTITPDSGATPTLFSGSLTRGSLNPLLHPAREQPPEKPPDEITDTQTEHE